MCWRTYETPIKQVAEKDIPVFKIMNIKDGKLKSHYIGFKYEVGKLYAGEIEDPEKVSNLWYDICMAFHSYSTECKVTKERNHFLVNLCGPDQKVIPILKGVWMDRIVRVNCLIPKGSIYYLNKRGEYASNKIEIISVENIE